MNDVAMMEASPAGVGAGLVRPRPQRIPGPMTRGLEDRVVGSPPTTQNIPTSSQHPTQQQTHVIEPDEPEPPQPQQQAAPRLVRPVALKVARPIPKEAVEEFYNEIYQQGVNASDVHAATVLAQDWHRKWTQQDEEGHTMPEPEADTSPYALQPRITSDNFAYDPLRDRESGAHNPSPEELAEELFIERKRLRVADFASPVSSPSSNENNGSQEELKRPSNTSISEQNEQNGVEPPSSKRRVLVFGNNMTISPDPVPPLRLQRPSPVLGGGLLRPVALRVQRPQAIDVSAAIDILAGHRKLINDHVPADIIKELRSQHSSLSPLTLPSVTSSYKKLKPAVVEEEEDTGSSEHLRIPSVISHVSKKKAELRPPEIEAARHGVLHRLAATGGDVVEDAEFLKHLECLKSFYSETSADTRFSTNPNATSEGMWLTLTKPTFFGNLGTNDDGDPMYTLGRMSFDMFSPTRLVCSLQGNFNSVEQVADGDRPAMLSTVPKALQEEVEAGNTILRTYNVITAFTIEPHLAAWPNAPNKDVRRPIRGIMTTEGYTLPDPENSNRHSVWITGGRIEPNDDPVDQREWNRQFAKNPPKHAFGEQAKLLAVKLLMGATIPTHVEEDGSLEYTFQRPIGGHGLAYVDTLYVDESIRIVQGHRGTIFVFSKLPKSTLNKR